MIANKKPVALTFANVPSDVKKIADESIGKNALESLWRAVEANSPNGDVVFYLILRVVSGVPVGFALFHYEVMTSDKFSYTIGIVDTVCVATRYRGNGYGSMLTFNVLKRMSMHGVNRVELVLKSPSEMDVDSIPSVPILGSERFLYDLGFKKIAYLKGHWEEDSMNYNYDCPLCHTIPDSCIGTLMAISEN
jgi:GNAT superfamily N-acetyltransferase